MNSSLKKHIRVVDTIKRLDDVLSLNDEELSMYIEDLSDDINSVNSFIDLAATAHQDKTVDVLINAPIDIIIRLLLYDSSITPIILEESDDLSGIRTRVAICKECVTVNGVNVSISAEDPMNICGFVINPSQFSGTLNSSIYNTIGSGKNPDVFKLLHLGSYLYSSINILATRQKSAVANAINFPIKSLFLKCKTGDFETIPKLSLGIPNIRKCIPVIFTKNLKKDVMKVVKYYAAVSSFITNSGSARLIEYICNKIVAIPDHKPQEINYKVFKGHEPNLPGVAKCYNDGLLYLLNKLNKIYKIDISPSAFIFNSSPITDLFRTKSLHAFQYILSDGRESENAAIILNRLALDESRQNAELFIRNQMMKNAAKARQYMIIIEDKLGMSRVKDIQSELLSSYYDGSSDDPGIILKALVNTNKTGKRDKEIVLTEYENRSAEWNSQIGNKCPHINMVLRLRSATSAKVAFLKLQELEKYYMEKQRDKWIMCKMCNFRIICPHVDELIRIESKNNSYDEIRTRLMKYTTANKNENSYSYFCNICSERLADFISEDRTAEIMEKNGYIDDVLRKLIWVEAIKTSSIMRFGLSTNPKRFASNAVDVCHPLLLRLENNAINKRGRRSLITDNQDDLDEQVDVRTHLYVILLVYAYILNLIKNNDSGRDKISTNIGIEGVKPDSKFSVYVEHLLNLLVRNHSYTISKIEDITNEYIAQQFLETYRMVVESVVVIDYVEPDIVKTFIKEIIIVDPIYNYIASAAKLMGVLPISKPKTPNDAKKEIQVVMGQSLDKIVTIKSKSEQNVKLYKNMFISPNKLSSNEIKEYLELGKINSQIFFNPIPINKNNLGLDPILSKYDRARYTLAYNIFVKYTIGILSNKDLDEFIEQANELKRCESMYSQLVTLRGAFSFCNILSAFTNKSRQYTYKHDIPITALFDEDGIKHQWDIFIYQAGKVQFTVQEMMKSDNKFLEYDIYDKKCSTCGILHSETLKLNEEKVYTSLHARVEFDSFFSYYETRCPTGSLHSFKEDLKCDKCGINSNITHDHNSKENSTKARQYYDKYKDIYSKDKQVVANKIHIFKDKPKKIGTTEYTILQKKVDQWVYDYGIIVNTVNLLNNNLITAATIEAIGAMEKRDYTAIKDGIGVIDPPEESDDARILSVDSSVRLFLTHYSSLRNYSSLLRPPQHIANILLQLKTDVKLVDQLMDLLPDIENDYHRQFKIFRSSNRTPKDVLLFSIETLCRMVLTVAAVKTHNEVDNLCKVFAITELELIIKSEKLLSKPGKFNFSIFGAEIWTGNDVDDDLIEDVPEGSDEDGTNPFSLEHVDITDIDNLD